jgi:hypothetical protein
MLFALWCYVANPTLFVKEKVIYVNTVHYYVCIYAPDSFSAENKSKMEKIESYFWNTFMSK